MRRPRVITACVADRYSDHTRERIIEFIDQPNGVGGLISFTRKDDGRLLVSVYNCDSGVDVLYQHAPHTALVTAAKVLLEKLDHITTEQFAHGAERVERETLREVLRHLKKKEAA